jgi:tRNA(Ile)-lysidine synthase
MEKTSFKKVIENTIISNVITNNLIQDNDKIVVAVSGGPDSMCLLNSLINIKEAMKEKYNICYTLCVAHVNHMIRKESDDEKIYVEEFCKKHDIPFFYLKADVPNLSKELKLSEETCGRKVRYEFFDKVLKEVKASKIAVAHNLDDNVETILYNLIRGCGLKGISGINYITGNIIRPLLSVEKKDMKYIAINISNA